MFIYRDEYYLEQRMPKLAAFDNEEKFQSALDECTVRWIAFTIRRT